jgi:phosphatidylglycerophosphate synthase
MTDFVLSAGLLILTIAVLVAYGIRVIAKGNVQISQISRVEREGSSPFLGRTPMLVGYWAIIPIGRSLARAGVTANSVTALSLVFGAASGVAIALGHFGVGAVLFVTSALCDALDGFIARETGTESHSGGTFDAAVDRYNDFFFLAGLALCYRQNAIMLGLALLALLGSFMVSYATVKAAALRVTPPRGSMRRVERATYLTAAVGFSPIVGFFNPSLADAPVVLGLLLVGTVANASAVWRFVRSAELVRAEDERRAPEETQGRMPEPSAHELESASR